MHRPVIRSWRNSTCLERFTGRLSAPVNMRPRALWTILIAASLGLPLGAFAQQPTTGTLVIRVSEQAGGALAGARVTVVGPLGERAATTDESGEAQVWFLPSGAYRVRVELVGFNTIEIPDVSVSAGERTRLPIQLTPGTIEEVTVTAAVPLVDLKRTEVTTTFDIDQSISTLPVGRRFTDIVAFAPGVVSGFATGE